MGLTDIFDISIERANQFYAWGWRLSVFGAAITMLGIAALWLGTRVRDHDFESKIERAAKSEKDLLKLKGQVAPRRLTLEQNTAFISMLSGRANGEIDVNCNMVGDDSCDFAQDIAKALRTAGWKVKGPGSIFTGGIVEPGIVLSVKHRNIERAFILQGALKYIGFASVIKLAPDSANEVELYLYIGPKPFVP